MRAGSRSKALVSAWLDFQPPAQRALAQSLRAAVREAEPGLDEVIRWGQLVFVWAGSPLIAISPHRGHVSLQFLQGHLLPPTLAPLEGQGRGSRNLKLRLHQPVDVVRVQMLVAAAVARAPREARTPRPPDDAPD
jgi:hypothetical protein